MRFQRLYFIALCVGAAYLVGVIANRGQFYLPSPLAALWMALGGIGLGFAIAYLVPRLSKP